MNISGRPLRKKPKEASLNFNLKLEEVNSVDDIVQLALGLIVRRPGKLVEWKGMGNTQLVKTILVSNDSEQRELLEESVKNTKSKTSTEIGTTEHSSEYLKKSIQEDGSFKNRNTYNSPEAETFNVFKDITDMIDMSSYKTSQRDIKNTTDRTHSLTRTTPAPSETVLSEPHTQSDPLDIKRVTDSKTVTSTDKDFVAALVPSDEHVARASLQKADWLLSTSTRSFKSSMPNVLPTAKKFSNELITVSRPPSPSTEPEIATLTMRSSLSSLSTKTITISSLNDQSAESVISSSDLKSSSSLIDTSIFYNYSSASDTLPSLPSTFPFSTFIQQISSKSDL